MRVRRILIVGDFIDRGGEAREAAEAAQSMHDTYRRHTNDLFVRRLPSQPPPPPRFSSSSAVPGPGCCLLVVPVSCCCRVIARFRLAPQVRLLSQSLCCSVPVSACRCVILLVLFVVCLFVSPPELASQQLYPVLLSLVEFRLLPICCRKPWVLQRQPHVIELFFG